jgi:hypothetical protein
MLSDHQVYAAIPTADLDAARGVLPGGTRLRAARGEPAGIYTTRVEAPTSS